MKKHKGKRDGKRPAGQGVLKCAAATASKVLGIPVAVAPDLKAAKRAKIDAWRKEVAAKGSAPNPALEAAMKAADANRTAKKTGAARAKAAKKPGCLQAAVRVLREAAKPMTCETIVKVALEKGWWATKGATPGATLYAAVIREIADPRRGSRFRRAEVKATKGGKAVALRGYFRLTEGQAREKK